MKLTITIEKLLYALILSYSMMHIVLEVIMPNAINKYVLLILFCAFLYYNKIALLKQPRKFICFYVVCFFYIVYTVFNYGTYQLLHSDFYTFVFLVIIFLCFSNRRIRDRYLEYHLKYFKVYIFCSYVIVAIVVFSIVFGNGLHSDSWSNIPFLYGPYSVPHELGYMFMAIYCGISLKQEKNIIYTMLKVICVVCTIWTGARSAVLAIAVVVVTDFFSMRKISAKVMVAITGGCVVAYLLLFTDILYSNPLIQKTLLAIQNGSITNGRERFSKILLDYYQEESFVTKIFGVGMANVRQALKTNPTIGVSIHAHNDYLNALVGYGLLGMIIYIYSQVKIWFSQKDKAIAFMLQAMLFVLIYFNGLAMYSVFTPVLPIVFVFFDKCIKE